MFSPRLFRVILLIEKLGQIIAHAKPHLPEKGGRLFACFYYNNSRWGNNIINGHDRSYFLRLNINDVKKQKLRKKRTDKTAPEKLNITAAIKNKPKAEFVAFAILPPPFESYSNIIAPNKNIAAMETTIIVSL